MVDKFLIIDSQQPGIDYTLMGELVSKSACDYEVCVCVHCQSRGEEVTTDYPEYLWLFV